MLLYQAGQATHEILNTIPETEDDFATAMEKLDSYFTPKKNVAYEIFQFQKTVQQSGETVNQFVAILRILASTREFTGIERENLSPPLHKSVSQRI